MPRRFKLCHRKDRAREERERRNQVDYELNSATTIVMYDFQNLVASVPVAITPSEVADSTSNEVSDNTYTY